MQKDHRPLDEAELEQLETFLFSDRVPETALDTLGVQGLLTALTLAPVRSASSDWLPLIFDGEPKWSSQQEAVEITQLLERLSASIHQALYSDQEVELPCELTLEVESDEEETDLAIWAQGFMEGVFLNEADWFAVDEDAVAELLLPIMVASGLFDDPEIIEIRNNPDLCEELAEQIPEVLIDLYLLFNAPDK